LIRRKTSRYIYFGTGLRFLQDASAGSRAVGDSRYTGNLSRLFDLFDELGLVVSSRAAKMLKGPELLAELEERDPSHKLTAAEARRVKDFARELRTTIMAEAKGLDAFIVSEKRMDVEKLLGDVGALFPDGAFDALPEIAQLDFEEAGKCIAFERPTAAAFHLMRGTEAVLRDFYLSIVKRKRVKPLNWGPMVKQLRDRRSPPPDALLDNLDGIRRNFRNPTQHPDAVYEIDEAQDLLGICIDVVSRMHRSR
jgi:hypothetical protein